MGDYTFEDVIAETVKLQRSIADAIRVAVDIMHGPDAELRAEALATLIRIADEIDNSASRLSEHV